MGIDYKKELETAAKRMILVHDPDMLIKLILRTTAYRVRVTHAAMLLRDPSQASYVLMISRGPGGLKVPEGFARMDKDNPLIRLFSDRSQSECLTRGAFAVAQAKRLLCRKSYRQCLPQYEKVMYQMDIFAAQVAIPVYFRNDLLGVLMLGDKKNRRPFRNEELDFLVALSQDVAMALKNAELFKEVQLELKKRKQLFIDTTIALAAAIEAKDQYTRGHTNRVYLLSRQLAQRLQERHRREYPVAFMEQLEIAGLLHDIGKIGIPESILNKDGPLNEEERRKMQDHPSVGANILQPIKELETVILGVKYHHERFDGKGYPEGLKGEQIPFIAAIISVADTFDAMTTNRPYRKGLSKEEAVQEIGRLKGEQFHPEVADVLVELWKEGKV